MQSRMTTKGQVTIPQPVRRKLGLAPGSTVCFIENAAGETVVVPQPDAHRGAGERRVADFRAAMERTRHKPVDFGMTGDAFMALIREPVPL